jgi:DNA-binding XRE family transcriptional regulator
MSDRDEEGLFLPGHGAGGRPSTYSDEKADLAVQCMQQGYSKVAVAGFLGISRKTFQNWEKDHPYFREMIEIGESARCLHLETGLLKAGTSQEVTSRIFALKNAAPTEWKDRHTQEMTGPDGGPIKAETVISDDLKSALDQIAAKIAARDSEG